MKKIVIGITAPKSIMLLEGQLEYFIDKGYILDLLGPNNVMVQDFCKNEGAGFLPVDIEREIHFLKDIIALVQIFIHLKKVKPDIVNLGTPKMAFLGLLSSWVLGIKVRIYTCRGFRFEHEKGILRFFLVLVEKMTSFFSHKIICISESVKELGVNTGIFHPDKCIIINKGSSNGVDLNRFNKNNISLAETEQLRKELSLNNCFVFGFVGRLIDRKGINELFHAFKILFNDIPSLKLLIVGPIEENQIADKKLISNMGKHPGVVLAGSQKKVPLFLSVMDVFVLPAWWEGFGNVLIQAAAMGVPVIGTDSTGVKDAISNNYNGLIVEPKSINALAEAMRSLYLNEDLRKRLGRNGIEWAENFKNEIIWKGMEELYLAN